MSEIPRPPDERERDNTQPEFLFNVEMLEKMDDEQVIIMQRCLRANEDRGHREGEWYDASEVSHGLASDFRRSVYELAKRDPVRVRNIVQRCATSIVYHDWDFAALTVGSLYDYDYEFVRDTLFRFLEDNTYKERIGAQYRDEQSRSYDMRWAAREVAIPRLMATRFTPEQIDEFNQRLEEIGDRPVSPGEIQGFIEDGSAEWY